MVDMNKKITAIMLALVTVAIVSAGCLGGGSSAAKGEKQTEKNLVPKQEKVTFEDVVPADATIEDVTVTKKIPVSLNGSVVTAITFKVNVEDAAGEYDDSNTNPDDVTGKITGANGESQQLSGGSTPYSDTKTFNAGEGNSLSTSWEVTLTVTCKASDDTWPGPLIWRGYPDHGFTYKIVVEYTQMVPEE